MIEPTVPTMTNPYRWDARRPDPAVQRDELHAQMVPDLAAGRSFVLVAGRGMGKSVFLVQLEDRLRAEPGIRPLLIDRRPQPLDVAACTAQLASAIGAGGTDRPDDASSDRSPADLLDRYFADPDAPNLVLLYDEIDLYADPTSGAGRDFFAALENARQVHQGRLGVVAAGGIGIYHLDTRLGSPFLGRATSCSLAPFTEREIERLGEPMARAGRAVDADSRAALRLMSGGHPLLVVYGLHHLWLEDRPSPARVRNIFSGFRERQHFFIESLYRGIGIGDEDEYGAGALWRYLHEHDPPHPAAKLQEVVGNSSPTRLGRALRLLLASGLVRIDGTLDDDPLSVVSVPSIVRPPGLAVPARPDLEGQLDLDL